MVSVSDRHARPKALLARPPIACDRVRDTSRDMSAPVPVHFVDEGPRDAPAVVLSGSLGSTLAMWDPQVPALSERFRVIRYDHRGHGGSPVPPGPYDVSDLAGGVVALADRAGVTAAHLRGLPPV